MSDTQQPQESPSTQSNPAPQPQPLSQGAQDLANFMRETRDPLAQSIANVAVNDPAAKPLGRQPGDRWHDGQTWFKTADPAKKD